MVSADLVQKRFVWLADCPESSKLFSTEDENKITINLNFVIGNIFQVQSTDSVQTSAPVKMSLKKKCNITIHNVDLVLWSPEQSSGEQSCWERRVRSKEEMEFSLKD